MPARPGHELRRYRFVRAGRAKTTRDDGPIETPWPVINPHGPAAAEFIRRRGERGRAARKRPYIYIYSPVDYLDCLPSTRPSVVQRFRDENTESPNDLQNSRGRRPENFDYHIRKSSWSAPHCWHRCVVTSVALRTERTEAVRFISTVKGTARKLLLRRRFATNGKKLFRRMFVVAR